MDRNSTAERERAHARVSDPAIEHSLDRVERWIEDHGYRGFEPFDGLTSYFLPLTFGSLFARQALQQAVRRSPIDVRPLIGVKPLESTKGRGYVAWGYLKRYRLTGDPTYRDKALACLDWLDLNRSPLYPEHSWGNHFFYASRSGYIRKHESTVVWTGLIGQVFLEAYELFGLPRHREIIRSIADWIMRLPREETSKGLCLSYTMPAQSSIHNSNMIGAAFLAGAAAVTGDEAHRNVARRAMEYSCSRQLEDGAWYYGEAKKHHWIDVFHTGYKLEALRRYRDFSGDTSFSAVLEKGYGFFKRHFFEPSGRVRYYHDRARPIDIQCASQAIDTLCLFAPEDAEALPSAANAARWYIRRMQAPDGHFHFRHYARGVNNRAAMIHWGQATMHKALSHLLLAGRAGKG